MQERGCVTLETTVAEDDEASLAWADRRGFREVGRNSRLVLDLTRSWRLRSTPRRGSRS